MAITGSTDLGLGRKAVTVDHDPTVTSTDAPKGSLIIDGDGVLYQKQDDGATTNVSNATTQGTTYTCPASLAIDDWVYVSSADNVDKADASNSAKMPAVGIIVTKPTSTSCVLQYANEVLLSGLTAGAQHYVSDSTPGAITATAPTADGSLVQAVGVARSTTRLVVELGEITQL